MPTIPFPTLPTHPTHPKSLLPSNQLLPQPTVPKYTSTQLLTYHISTKNLVPQWHYPILLRIRVCVQIPPTLPDVSKKQRKINHIPMLPIQLESTPPSPHGCHFQATNTHFLQVHLCQTCLKSPPFHQKQLRQWCFNLLHKTKKNLAEVDLNHRLFMPHHTPIKLKTSPFDATVLPFLQQ